MICALPDMVVPIAFCSCAALDEDSMSEMTCCDMKTRKIDGLKTSIGRLVVVVDEEEEISRRSAMRIRCRSCNRVTKLLSAPKAALTYRPTPIRNTKPTLATSAREISLFRQLA